MVLESEYLNLTLNAICVSDYEYNLKFTGKSEDHVYFKKALGSSTLKEIDVSLWFRTSSNQNLSFFTYEAPGRANREFALQYIQGNGFTVYVQDESRR